MPQENGSRGGLSISVNCIKTTLQDLDRIFQLHHQFTFSLFEKYKQENGLTRIGDEAYPVIMSLQNRSNETISKIGIDIFLRPETNDNDSAHTFTLKFSGPNLIIKPKDLTKDLLLLDLSGFPATYVQVGQVEYKIGTKKVSELPNDMQFIVDTVKISNPFMGFDNAQEMETHHLLSNYLQNSLPARGISLKLMLRMLTEVSSGELRVDGKTHKLSEQDRRSLLGTIQIEIISRIMMYVEDLIILMDSMQSVDGNYYKLLDGGEYGDLGDRIRTFFDDLENLTSEQIRHILHYADPNTLSLEPSECAIVARLVDENIRKFKEAISKIKIFGKTHRQVYRRYKHAGFPFRPGYSFGSNFPFTDKKFDFYSMVYAGKNPLNDVIPLPYSEQVISSYKTLILMLQTLIEDVVSAKIACIEREVDGIIPNVDYSRQNTLSKEEVQQLIVVQRKFNEKHPIHMKNYLFQFALTYPKREDVQWYTEL